MKFTSSTNSVRLDSKHAFFISYYLGETVALFCLFENMWPHSTGSSFKYNIRHSRTIFFTLLFKAPLLVHPIVWIETSFGLCKYFHLVEMRRGNNEKIANVWWTIFGKAATCATLCVQFRWQKALNFLGGFIAHGSRLFSIFLVQQLFQSSTGTSGWVVVIALRQISSHKINWNN